MPTIRKDDWEPKPEMPLAPIQHILDKLSYDDASDLIEFFIELHTKRGE